jgi:hypothetical protein
MRQTFIPTNTAAFLSDTENSDVEKYNRENLLLELICGKLQGLVAGRVVARSDNDPWLKTSSKHTNMMLKPDALIINRAFLIDKGDKGGPILRGIPAHESLYYGTTLIDFKLVNSTKAFGELVIHLQHLFANALAFNKEGRFVVKGALAHKEGIELVTLAHGNVIKLESLLWTAGGSAARLSDFFSEELNPIARALNELLETANLNLNLSAFRPCLLGIGGTGSVFLVNRSPEGSRREMALEIVAGKTNLLRLKLEWKMNAEVAERAADLIVKAPEFFLCDNVSCSWLADGGCWQRG